MIVTEADVARVEEVMRDYETHWEREDLIFKLSQRHPSFADLNDYLEFLPAALVTKILTFAEEARRHWEVRDKLDLDEVEKHDAKRWALSWEAWSEVDKWRRGPDWEPSALERADALFAEHPHLIMVLGFDEYQVFRLLDEAGYVDDASFERYSAFLKDHAISDDLDFFEDRPTFRDGRSGAWMLLAGFADSDDGRSAGGLRFKGSGPKAERIDRTDEWVWRLRDSTRRADPIPRTLWLPSPWTPQLRQEQRSGLKRAVHPLLLGLMEERIALSDIGARQLEDLVGELLADQGLEIQVTPRTGDGGRDIVARGELFPGEPCEMAVEVKQQRAVGLRDVQRALRANEDYPAVMLATAGRFSAGVIREKARNRNRMRLFLKDGVALSQWIAGYGIRQGWPRRLGEAPRTSSGSRTR